MPLTHLELFFVKGDRYSSKFPLPFTAEFSAWDIEWHDSFLGTLSVLQMSFSHRQLP